MLTPTVIEVTRAGRTGITLPPRTHGRRTPAPAVDVGVHAVAWRTSPH
jgi:hypothetical protein